jgi:DNA-binding transcriptional MerR regulator
MNTSELCASTGLTAREVQNWLDNGLLEPADFVGRASGGGLQREFTADQAERARLLKALHRKGATLAQLARANLSLAGQAYVVYDGHDVRACRDAAAAIAAW